MSLLKWKKLAKSKSELGDKINTVRNAINLYSMVWVKKQVKHLFQRCLNQ